MPKFKVEAEADIGSALSGLGKVQTELAKTAVAAQKFDSSVGKMGAGLGKVAPGANQATNALTNFGRIVQDAPFGIIGITNNINPLLESFQRLKVESGSTGGALKALAGSLIGGGGLGLAVSIVTSLLTVFALNTRSAGSGVSDLSKKTSEYDKALKDAIATTAEEVSQVAVLVESYKKENLTKQERVKIIEQLQSIAPAYFSKLDKEKTTIDQLTSSYNAYAASILRSVEIKVREGQLSKIIEKRIALQDKATRSITEDIDENGKLRKSINAVYDEESKGISKNFNLRLLTVQEQRDLNKLLQDEKMLITAIAGLKQPQDFLDGKGKAVKDARTIADVLKDLNKELDFISKKNILIDSEKAKASIGALENALDELLKDFGLKTTNPIVVDIAFRINYAKAKLATDELFANIKQVVSGTRQGEKDKMKIEVNVQPIFKVDPAGIDKGLLEFRSQATAAIQQTFTGIITDSISAVADAAGEAIAGGGNFLPNLFEGLIKGIGSQLKELGKYLVQVGVEMIVAKKAIEALKLTPQTAIIAGFALQLLGSTLTAAATKKFNSAKFATGVRNFEGGIATVGERGPETIFLPRGSSVQPNNEVNAFGAGSQVFIPAIRLSGSDLVIAFNRASAQMGRNN